MTGCKGASERITKSPDDEMILPQGDYYFLQGHLEPDGVGTKGVRALRIGI